jgi:hypothetical protein
MRYEKHRDSPLWKALARAVEALEKNSDVVIQTDRDHVIGYLAECMIRSISTSENRSKTERSMSTKSKRIIDASGKNKKQKYET